MRNCSCNISYLFNNPECLGHCIRNNQTLSKDEVVSNYINIMSIIMFFIVIIIALLHFIYNRIKTALNKK